MGVQVGEQVVCAEAAPPVQVYPMGLGGLLKTPGSEAVAILYNHENRS